MRESRIWRVPAAELRAAADGSLTLTGYGAVFDKFSQNLGGFVEMIAPGAFDDVLARSGNNVAGLVNHDANWLLATTDSGTLDLSVDDIGLAYAMLLDSGDPDAVRAAAKVRSGKMRGSSFSFTVGAGGDEWSLTPQGFPLRTIRSFAGLFDVGPVTFPAYKGTEADGLATALRSLADVTNTEVGRLVDLARSNELRSMFPPIKIELDPEVQIGDVAESPDAEPADPAVDPLGPMAMPESDSAAQHARTDDRHNRTRMRFGLPTT